MNQQLHFDEATHTYTVKGIHVPSVTEILAGVGVIDFDAVPEWCRERGLERGSYVHLATQFFDEGDLDWNTVDPDLRGYVHAYIAFRQDTGFEPHLIEHQGYNPVLRYAGTLDRAGIMNQRNILLDIKTGTTPKWVCWQTAGYQNMGIQTLRYVERYALELREDGHYRLSEAMFNTQDFRDFVSFIGTYYAKLRKGIIKQKGTDNDGR